MKITLKNVNLEKNFTSHDLSRYAIGPEKKGEEKHSSNAEVQTPKNYWGDRVFLCPLIRKEAEKSPQ